MEVMELVEIPTFTWTMVVSHQRRCPQKLMELVHSLPPSRDQLNLLLTFTLSQLTIRIMEVEETLTSLTVPVVLNWSTSQHIKNEHSLITFANTHKSTTTPEEISPILPPSKSEETCSRNLRTTGIMPTPEKWPSSGTIRGCWTLDLVTQRNCRRLTQCSKIKTKKSSRTQPSINNKITRVLWSHSAELQVHGRNYKKKIQKEPREVNI